MPIVPAAGVPTARMIVSLMPVGRTEKWHWLMTNLTQPALYLVVGGARVCAPS